MARPGPPRCGDRGTCAGGGLRRCLPAGARDHAAAELAAARRRGHLRGCAGGDRGVRRARQHPTAHDAALPFAWSTAATIEPLVGVTFFPRIFADVEAAESSVHILMFGWREGEIGMEMAALLRRKLAEGVDMIGRILAAAQRGVAVRLVVSQTSNNTQATAALKHYYGALAEAGVELWELPGTVVHAKVVVADDVVSFCTVNLDAWALYRYNAIMMLAQSAETAELLEERPFEPDISRSQRGVPPEGARERFESRLWSALGSFL